MYHHRINYFKAADVRLDKKGIHQNPAGVYNVLGSTKQG